MLPKDFLHNLLAGSLPPEMLGPPRFSSEGPKFYQQAFAANRQYAKPGPYQETLPPAQEQQFRQWVAANNVPFDPNAKTVDYDMRGYWRAMLAGQAPPWKQGSHFPDTYKTPYDTSFSNESKYATADSPLVWRGDNLLINLRTGFPQFAPPSGR